MSDTAVQNFFSRPTMLMIFLKWLIKSNLISGVCSVLLSFISTFCSVSFSFCFPSLFIFVVRLKARTVWVGTKFKFELTSQPLKNYVL